MNVEGLYNMSQVNNGDNASESDAVVAEFVAEGFHVVPSVGGEAPQVAGVAPGDLRADLRVVFL
jgi:hypothetical protein